MKRADNDNDNDKKDNDEEYAESVACYSAQLLKPAIRTQLAYMTAETGDNRMIDLLWETVTDMMKMKDSETEMVFNLNLDKDTAWLMGSIMFIGVIEALKETDDGKAKRKEK
jgi:hypothetical protein